MWADLLGSAWRRTEVFRVWVRLQAEKRGKKLAISPQIPKIFRSQRALFARRQIQPVGSRETLGKVSDPFGCGRFREPKKGTVILA